MYFSKKSSVYSWALIRQTKYLLMMTKKRSTKIVNFFIPVAGGLVQGYGRISHSVKMHYFFIRLLFYFRALIRQTKYIVIMTNKCLQKLQISTPQKSSSLLSAMDQKKEVFNNADQGRIYQNC